MKKQFLSALAAILFSSTLFALTLPHSGKVLETMDSGGYTYIKVSEKEKQYWLAVAKTNVKKGETFLFYEQMWMKNFRSNTLNRTFDKILFAKNASKPKVQKTMPAKITKGQIADILKNKNQLENKTVQVKGTVVKVSRGIMNNSWVHIEDAHKNKLIFRAEKESVNIGDKVSAKGTLNIDVDYGYGYTYEAIVLNSSFTK